MVENHPDCSEDMDILGFSLYHENNHNVAKVSDDDDASDNSKRWQVVLGDSESGPSMLDLTGRLWEEINKSGNVLLCKITIMG